MRKHYAIFLNEFFLKDHFNKACEETTNDIRISAQQHVTAFEWMFGFDICILGVQLQSVGGAYIAYMNRALQFVCFKKDQGFSNG